MQSFEIYIFCWWLLPRLSSIWPNTDIQNPLLQSNDNSHCCICLTAGIEGLRPQITKSKLTPLSLTHNITEHICPAQLPGSSHAVQCQGQDSCPKSARLKTYITRIGFRVWDPNMICRLAKHKISLNLWRFHPFGTKKHLRKTCGWRE